MPKNPAYRLLLLLTGIHAIWFFLATQFNGIYLKDSFEYLYQATNLREYGIWYAGDLNAPIVPELYSFRPPLYGAFIATIKAVLPSDFAVLFVQNLLSIVNLMLVYRICRESGVPEKGVRMLILISLLFFPTQLVLANMVMSDMLFQSLLLWLCYSCLLFYRKPEWKMVVVITVITSLLLLTKPVALLIPVVVLFWILFSILKRQLPFKVYVVVWPLFIGVPFTLHWVCSKHEQQTGYYHYSSMKAFNQFKFHGRFVLANRYGETMQNSGPIHVK